MPAAGTQEHLLEEVVGAPQIVHTLIGPGMLEVLAETGRKLRIGAFAGEVDLEERTYLEEGKELVVGAIGLARDQACDLSLDRLGTEVLHDRSALVAFEHIEAVQELIDLDRIAEAVCDLYVIEVRPLHRELGVLGQDRKERARERDLAAFRAGTHDLRERNLERAERLLPGKRLLARDRIERCQIGMAALRLRPPAVALALLHRLAVVLVHAITSRTFS